jgi:hypothetical protein
MESLAIVIVILFSTALLAGPLSIALSSNYVKSRLESKASLGFTMLNILRKAFHLLLITFGNLIGVQFLVITGFPLIPRLVGMFSIVTCYIGLRREYFPEFFMMGNLRSRFGGSRKNGRSSGRDGNGPAGQH